MLVLSCISLCVSVAVVLVSRIEKKSGWIVDKLEERNHVSVSLPPPFFYGDYCLCIWFASCFSAKDKRMTTTSINPNDINLFAVDCSHNMRQSHTFEDGEFTAKRLMTRSSLDLALDYARYRIIQMVRLSSTCCIIARESDAIPNKCIQVDRNLKTLHAGVLMFPSAKTKNVLTSQAKEAHGTSFDKKTDPYAHFREKIALDHPVTSMIPQLTEEAVLALADQREVNMNYADEYDDRHWRTDREFNNARFFGSTGL